MRKEAKTGGTAPGERATPSLSRTTQALRKIKGGASRVPLELRVIAIRNSKQLA